MLLRALVILSLQISASLQWDISAFTTRGSQINKVTIWGTKAFLCVPRLKGSSATLLLTWWPEKNADVSTTSIVPFPSQEFQSLEKKSNVLSAVSSDVTFTGLLFVLDVGFSVFPPKILIFDLARRNKVVSRVLLEGAPASLTCLVADPVGLAIPPMVYIADSANQRLIVYDHKYRKWWPVQLTSHNGLTGLPIVSEDICSTLAASKTEPTLFVTSESTAELFSLDLMPFRQGSHPPGCIYNDINFKSYNVTLKNVGQKLGTSVGLQTDYKGGVHYYLPRFHATVRWDSESPLIAENHRVTHQSKETMPGATGFFMDCQKQVWLVLRQDYNDTTNQRNFKHCVRVQNSIVFRSDSL